MIRSAGIDVGSAAVKVVIFDVAPDEAIMRAAVTRRVRQGDAALVARTTFDEALRVAGCREGDVDYVATTGEPGAVAFRTGHFYSMTTHARGALHLMPDARAVLDVGALHGRAIAIDPQGKVLGHRMSSQCASGSGRFLENIAQWLGVAADEIGSLSRSGRHTESVSSICAVLAETDVINMVARGAVPADIVHGIHRAMASRLAKLIGGLVGPGSSVAVTGGLSADEGLLAALEHEAATSGSGWRIRTHPHAIHAGAIGAALWGAFRHARLAARGEAS